jgi:4'-phosphopantetheinyl transferase
MGLNTLEKATVKLRWLQLRRHVLGHLPRWHAILDPTELSRADRFVFAADRESFVAAHALARSMLSEVTGRPPASWRFATGAFGKPAVLSDGFPIGLGFNISHTQGFVACALAHEDVGVDVEASDRPIELDIAERFFAREEVEVLNALPAAQRRRAFFRFWTLKEAFIKATGEGLHRPLDSFSFTLDPVRIAFHPERRSLPHREDPAEWHFAEYCPIPDRPVALAVRHTSARPLHLDACPATAEEIAPHGK